MKWGQMEALWRKGYAGFDPGHLCELAEEGRHMFLGQYERILDDKGRLAIPAELRAGLGKGAVMTRSFDKCLCIYPAARWETLALAIDDLPDIRTKVRELARRQFGSAVACEFDRQGRVCVPAFLRERAGLQGDVVVVGVYSRVEIWNRDAWMQEQDKFESQGPSLAAALSLSRA